MNFLSKYRKVIAGIIVAILLLIVGNVALKYSQSKVESQTQEQTFGNGDPFQSASYVTAIGSAASPATLTSSYNNASSTGFITTGLPNVVVGGTYTPKSYGSSLFILVERSYDGGTTYFPYDVISPSASTTLVYTAGVSSTAGIPFTLPANTTAASGTAITFSWDMTMAADFIRFKAKESTTSTAGTLNLQALFTSN